MRREYTSGLLSTLRVEGCTLSLARYAPGMRMPFHAHDTMDIGFVLSGSLEEEVGRDRRLAFSGSVVIKPAGTVHRNVFGREGALMLGLRFCDMELDESTKRSLRKWNWLSSIVVARFAFNVSQSVQRGSPAANISQDVADLLAAIVNEITHDRANIPKWLNDLRRRIETDDSPIAAIAQELSLHQIYIARKFRAAFGCSPREYRSRARMMRALQLLSDREMTLSAAGQRGGFADHAHLSRQAKQLLGLSPSALRSLQRYGVMEG